ncbi:MAG: copper chaperone PCu(A)C [Burkholderiaceae bacterium]
MQFGRLLTCITTLAISALALAHDYKVGNLQIEHTVARPSFPGQPSGAAYLTIENHGKVSDKLMSVSSPIAQSAQIHTMSMEGNVMRMREVDGIELKPTSKTVMQPGNGYHIMLVGLKKPLNLGDQFPLTLMFEKAGKLNVSITVEEVKSGMEMTGKDSTSHSHK